MKLVLRCRNTTCRGTCMTEYSDTIDGFKLGNIEHNHPIITSGEQIRNEMIRKGLKRAMESISETIPKILRDLVFEFLTVENSTIVDWSAEAVKFFTEKERNAFLQYQKHFRS